MNPSLSLPLLFQGPAPGPILEHFFFFFFSSQPAVGEKETVLQVLITGMLGVGAGSPQEPAKETWIAFPGWEMKLPGHSALLLLKRMVGEFVPSYSELHSFFLLVLPLPARHYWVGCGPDCPGNQSITRLLQCLWPLPTSHLT